MFDWDNDNRGYIWSEHRVGPEEVEQALEDPFQRTSAAYSFEGERREAIIGMTTAGRLLFVVFTWRGDRIRPISARNAMRHEAQVYRRKRR